MNLSVKIKKEEEDSVVYISCNGQDIADPTELQKLSMTKDVSDSDEGIQDGFRYKKIGMGRPEFQKIKECRHRPARRDVTRLLSRNNVDDTLLKHRGLENAPLSPHRCFIDRTIEPKAHSKQGSNFDLQPEKRFKCGYCKSKFTRRSSLNRHMECIHRDIKAYECDICLENFSTRPIRDKHRDFHMKGEKLYRCKTCEKAFLYPEMLVRHTNWHKRTDDKILHRCYICAESFSSPESLTSHLEQIHHLKVALKSTMANLQCSGSTVSETCREDMKSVPRISKVYSMVDQSGRQSDNRYRAVQRAPSRSEITISLPAVSHKKERSKSPSPDRESRELKLQSFMRSTKPVSENSSVFVPKSSMVANDFDNDQVNRREDRPLMRTNFSIANYSSLADGNVTPYYRLNKPSSEVRTKSSLKRKLLHSLAARREGTFPKLCRRGFDEGARPCPQQDGNTSMRNVAAVPVRKLAGQPNVLLTRQAASDDYEKGGANYFPNAPESNIFSANTIRPCKQRGGLDLDSPNIERHKPGDLVTSNCNMNSTINRFVDSSFRLSPGKDRPDDNRDFDEVYECPKCGKDYQACRYMETHLLLHDDMTDIPCRFCAKKFISKKDLEKHIHTKHTSKQKLCKKINGQSSKTLKADVDEINRVLTSVEALSNGNGDLKSNFLEMASMPLESSTENVIEVPSSIGRVSERRDTTTMLSPIKKFKCGFCTSTFAIASELERHIREHFLCKPFICALCSEAFGIINDLEQHLHDHKEPVPLETAMRSDVTESRGGSVFQRDCVTVTASVHKEEHLVQ